jgi:hypothetical protein
MYEPIYCTKLDIARKLKGKLNIQVDEYTPAVYEQSLPSQAVDNELVDQIIEEKEEFISLILYQMYELPLNSKHPIIKEITTCLVCSELMRIHFQGSGISQLSGDLGGSGSDWKYHAYSLLSSLTAGLNIQIPGQPPVQTIPGAMIPQPLKLPGETRRRDYQANDLITNSYVYIQHNNIYNDTVNKSTIKDLEF